MIMPTVSQAGFHVGADAGDIVDDLVMIGKIVSENANLRLFGGTTLKLVEVLSLYLNVGDCRICLPVPGARIVIGDLEAFHVPLD